jgi:hypothetical protein
MFRRSTAIILASLSLASNAGAAVVALATPSGLAAGTKFRFLFVTTSTRNANPTDVADYNSFVNSDAGGATYNGSVVSWNAIASTSAVDARDNVGGYGDNVAVYLVNGTKLANDMTTGSGGLWSGNLLTTANISISSTVRNVAVWTGTQANGTKSGAVLGSSNPTAGSSGFTGGSWLSFIPFGQGATNAFYGVSQELTVIPAPGAIAVLGIAGLANRRRRR